jgi:hypothetical protein
MTNLTELTPPTGTMQAETDNNPVEESVVAATPASPRSTTPGCSGSTCGTVPPPPLPVPGLRANTYVYALGRIEPRFPRISVEKEFMQATGRLETAGLTDRQAFQKALADPQNRYLVRQLCWVMSIAGLDSYILVPREPSDYDLLVESLRPGPDANALDAVIGLKGPVAPPDMCNGLLLPMVVFDQLYSFDRDSLIKALQIPNPAKAKEFTASAAEVLDMILSVTDNAGATDGHRALNYLAVRDPRIYALVAENHNRGLALTSVETRPWRLSAARKIVEVLVTFTQRQNEFVEKHFVRVDVNDEFPFLASKWAPYFDH